MSISAQTLYNLYDKGILDYVPDLGVGRVVGNNSYMDTAMQGNLYKNYNPNNDSVSFSANQNMNQANMNYSSPSNLGINYNSINGVSNSSFNNSSINGMGSLASLNSNIMNNSIGGYNNSYGNIGNGTSQSTKYSGIYGNAVGVSPTNYGGTFGIGGIYPTNYSAPFGIAEMNSLGYNYNGYMGNTGNIVGYQQQALQAPGLAITGTIGNNHGFGTPYTGLNKNIEDRVIENYGQNSNAGWNAFGADVKGTSIIMGNKAQGAINSLGNLPGVVKGILATGIGIGALALLFKRGKKPKEKQTSQFITKFNDNIKNFGTKITKIFSNKK